MSARTAWMWQDREEIARVFSLWTRCPVAFWNRPFQVPALAEPGAAAAVFLQPLMGGYQNVGPYFGAVAPKRDGSVIAEFWTQPFRGGAGVDGDGGMLEGIVEHFHDHTAGKDADQIIRLTIVNFVPLADETASAYGADWLLRKVMLTFAA